jgi:actin-related protein
MHFYFDLILNDNRYVHSLEEALVVDIGAESTYISPVSEGLLLKDYLIKGNIGSKHLNAEFKDSLQERRKDYLSMKYLKDRLIFKEPKLFEYAQNELVNDVKAATFKLHKQCSYGMVYNEVIDNSIYELPDKTNIIIGKEAYDLPESLFTKNKNG